MSAQVKVSSMVCGACVRTITQAIQEQYPQTNVTTDLESQQVAVDGSISLDDLKAVIVTAGHEVAG